MNFTKIIILFLILICAFSIPVNAQILNGDFETGDYTGWTKTSGVLTVITPSPYGDYYLKVAQSSSSPFPFGDVYQSFSTDGYPTIKWNMSGAGNPEMWAYIYNGTNTTPFYAVKAPWQTWDWREYECDISLYDNIKFRVLCKGTGGAGIDDVILSGSSVTLMEFTNEPIEVGTYAHLECNLDDYWNTHANEHFYLSYDYYYKNMSNYTIIDYNELELNAQNTVNFIPTYYPYFNQTGGCEIKASILYTYHDPIYNEEQLGGIGYYVSTVLINSTYEPPEEPEEPEEPEIPEPEPEPDPEPEPPIPPTQPNGTGANQSINVSWTGDYYNAVNNTFGGLCSPIYNFTNWSLSPIYSLNNSIGEFNYHMNESFTQTMQDSSILYESINTIFGAIHPKIRNVITYYLIWVVLLIVLKKD